MNRHVLGISALGRDSAACILGGGELLAAAQEERFSRRKHDGAFPRRAVEHCLAAAGIALAEAAAAFPGEDDSPAASVIREELGGVEARACPHHIAHAASAFYPSPFSRAAVLTCDAAASGTAIAYGAGDVRGLAMRAVADAPHSPAHLYSAIAAHCGFRPGGGEYKLMGLAPYGEPRYLEVLRERLAEIRDDGAIRLRLEHFDWRDGQLTLNSSGARLCGGPSRPSETELTRRELDLARSMQLLAEEVMLDLARAAMARAGARELCLSGEMAFNCAANGRILRESGAAGLFIQPAAGDAGAALGAALWLWHEGMGRPRRVLARGDGMKAARLGPEYDSAAVRAALVRAGLPFEELAEGDIAPRAAQLIAEGRVVGWFQGRMEFGPRALGARSIIADPRRAEMREILNEKIKLREPFRPFAPAVLAERCGEYFELEGENPYMMIAVPVRPDKRLAVDESRAQGLERMRLARSVIPAATHVDYSARAQTVGAEAEPRFRELLRRFAALTGCPVVINTSFNVRGEPIVCSPDDALRCFLRTDMDFLVADRYLLDKRRMPPARLIQAEHFPPD